jgi:ribosome-associated toxin RatA of RatAB toxin-antitoxin module
MITASTDAAPKRLHDIVADLTTYPEWLDLVTKVESDEAVEGDVGPAFVVTLRAKVGPFARNKRLRMVRAEIKVPVTVRFERAETDGREHSMWAMTSLVEATDRGSTVTINLSYGGQMWSSMLDGVLGGVVATAVPQLQTYAKR